jgi:hypothetical protein
VRIREIGLPAWLFGVQPCQALIIPLRECFVVPANGRAHATRPTVHRQPELVVLIALQLQEMIATPERAELEPAISPLQRFEARVAEGRQ